LLELVKLLLNSVLSRKGARFSTINMKNFYLDTPMLDPKYVRIKLSDIPEEFIKEYNLPGLDHNGWIYFKICQGCYSLPQAGILANDLLQSCLVAEGFYKAASTPGLWRHKWRPLQFCLIVDYFGVEYVGIEHFNYLLELLKKFHGVQFNMAGNKLAGISIKCVCPSPMVPRHISLRKVMHLSSSMMPASTESRKLLALYSTTPGQSTTNSSLLSVP
jgi:hypothetical protein